MTGSLSCFLAPLQSEDQHRVTFSAFCRAGRFADGERGTPINIEAFADNANVRETESSNPAERLGTCPQ